MAFRARCCFSTLGVALLLLAACGSSDDDIGMSAPPGSPDAQTPSGGDSDGAPPAAGDGNAGSPCSGTMDCATDLGFDCVTTIPAFGTFPGMEFPGGYCTKDCSSSEEEVDCGPNGACVSLSSGGSGGGGTSLQMCARACMSSDECRTDEGYRCNIIAFGYGYCAPPGG